MPGSADVALVLEGTWPHAIGGVSTWVDGLIRGLPGVRFGVVHLYAGDVPGPPRLAVPKNVVWHRDLGLPDDLESVDPAAIARRVPETRVVHALSTGFAGLVAAEVKRQRGVPFVLTEHGIYWHEIEQGAPELETGLRVLGADVSGGNPCASRQGWVERFKAYARQAYAMADLITTVTAANRPLQAALGVPDALVIPNGVHLPNVVSRPSPSETASLHPSARLAASFRVGFVGRVTPLKDVRALIRGFAGLLAAEPAARLHLIGPAGDLGYAAGCAALAERLGVAERMHWAGVQPVATWLRLLDAVALTSRSEAEPLALLEAMAHGVPVVAPDVGGVRALVKGGEAPPAGFVLDPDRLDAGLPCALARLAASPALRRSLGDAGRQRTAGRSVEAVAEQYGAAYASLGSDRDPAYGGVGTTGGAGVPNGA